MEKKQLLHDFQNNYLRLEVLMGLINDQLQQEGKVEKKYIDDIDKFIQLLQDHLEQIKLM